MEERKGEEVIDVFPGVSEPFGQRPEPLQKDPATWKESLRLESFIQIQVDDGRVWAIRAPQLDARQSEDHLKRCVASAQIQRQSVCNVKWRKVVTNLKREPMSATRNSSIRLFYRAEHHMFLVKFGFTFGVRHVEAGTQHVYQMSQVPMLCFHVPNRNLHHVELGRRMFKDSDQKYYESYVFRPHKNYVVPAGTYYLILGLQKTLFSVQVIPDWMQLPSLHYLLFTSHKEREILYNTPPQTPRPQDESVTDVGVKRQHDWNTYVIPKKVKPNEVGEPSSIPVQYQLC
ncbi:hypothetical protein JTE90_002490 [Oedothorax gibbosus]|uniref:Uncharacterized protein n=1 Tax=Oedothorax gibbosus TaxID=931172 RepID=A0AAV6TT70_9ARAC|nr:hypothetical protein JTE90_002490 [Oedothorax gibbosus]